MVGCARRLRLSMVNSFKRVISPALVLAFCALEGVALGALSKVFDAQFGDGIVIQAVIGTFAAFAGTLAAYKFFDIKVGNKFRTFVIAADVRHGRPRPAGDGARHVRQPSSACSASAASACCSPSPAWCSACSC